MLGHHHLWYPPGQPPSVRMVPELRRWLGTGKQALLSGVWYDTIGYTSGPNHHILDNACTRDRIVPVLLANDIVTLFILCTRRIFKIPDKQVKDTGRDNCPKQVRGTSQSRQRQGETNQVIYVSRFMFHLWSYKKTHHTSNSTVPSIMIFWPSHNLESSELRELHHSNGNEGHVHLKESRGLFQDVRSWGRLLGTATFTLRFLTCTSMLATLATVVGPI